VNAVRSACLRDAVASDQGSNVVVSIEVIEAGEAAQQRVIEMHQRSARPSVSDAPRPALLEPSATFPATTASMRPAQVRCADRAASYAFTILSRVEETPEVALRVSTTSRA